MNVETDTGRKAERRELTEDIKDYLNLRMQIVRLNITEKISVALAGLISTAIMGLLYLLVILLLSSALAWWIGDMLENVALGFAIVGGFYIIVAVIFRVIVKRTVKGKMIDKFIADFSNDD